MTVVTGDVERLPAMSVEDVLPDADGVRYLTIDELAAVSGIPSRTIRYYQSKGVLPHPARRGRVAVYTEDHLARLERIVALQDRGLRLDAIRDVFEQVSDGTPSLQEWLGLDDHLTVPWLDELPLLLSAEEIAERMGQARDGLLDQMVHAGLVVPPADVGDPYTVTSPGLFEISLGLDRELIDYAVQLGALDIMRRGLSAACDELVTFFAEKAGAGFGDDVDVMARQLAALRPLGGDAVRIVFGQEMERALEEFVASGGVETFTRRGTSSGD